MSGYSAVAVDRAARPGLECPHCRHFLREAVQTEEGLRLCKSCFKQIQRSVFHVCILEWSNWLMSCKTQMSANVMSCGCNAVGV